jgi:hypothetical protein
MSHHGCSRMQRSDGRSASPEWGRNWVYFIGPLTILTSRGGETRRTKSLMGNQFLRLRTRTGTCDAASSPHKVFHLHWQSQVSRSGHLFRHKNGPAMRILRAAPILMPWIKRKGQPRQKQVLQQFENKFIKLKYGSYWRKRCLYCPSTPGPERINCISNVFLQLTCQAILVCSGISLFASSTLLILLVHKGLKDYFASRQPGSSAARMRGTSIHTQGYFWLVNLFIAGIVF